MNSSKILLVLAVLAVCGVTFTHAIKCYSCTDKKSCGKATSYECTSSMADATTVYLDIYHKNVTLNQISPNIECFKEYHKSSNGDFYYKGCIYSSIKGCQLKMKDHYKVGKFVRQCVQCNIKNECNPAGRAELHMGLPVVIAVLAVVSKFMWSN